MTDISSTATRVAILTTTPMIVISALTAAVWAAPGLVSHNACRIRPVQAESTMVGRLLRDRPGDWTMKPRSLSTAPFSAFRQPMILVPLLLILFACWSFWGWTVGDAKDIRWIRHWCGTAFVLNVALIAGGGGFMAARSMERSSARDRALDVLQAIADRIESGHQQLVLQGIRELDHRGDPDEDAYDLLDELPGLAAKLTPQTASPQPRLTQPPAPQTAAEDAIPLRY